MDFIFLLFSAYGLFIVVFPKYGPHYGNALKGRYQRNRYGINDHNASTLFVSRIFGIGFIIFGMYLYFSFQGV